MSELENRAWSSIDQALKSRGFRFAATRGGQTSYRGRLSSGKTVVPIRIAIDDPLMMPPPQVFIEDEAIRGRIRAHVNEDDSFCYAEAQVEEYDLYNGGGAILRVLESVKTTLDQVLHGSTTDDLQREFIAYWKPETFLHSDLPSGFQGPAVSVDWVRDERHGKLVTTVDRAKRWQQPKSKTGSAFVIRVDRPLNTVMAGGPGKSLASLRAWLGSFVDDLGALNTALSSDVIDGGTLVVVAPNGSVGATFCWPEVAKIAFKKAPLVRRMRAIARGEAGMVLERSVTDSLALPDLVNARLAEPSALLGKSIAVVGAGAIGSRVCLELARCGAGAESSPLLIVDPDLYQAVNFPRHVLPISAVRTSKAQAMADEVRRLHPALTVEFAPLDVFKILQRVARYDLVIDATGSNPVGLRLNAEAFEARRQGNTFPPILHASIHGNGLAVQTVLVTPTAHACLKCLRPEHGEFKANPLKPGVQTQFTSAACGDGAHVTYAATAPALAAALVVQAVLEWADDPAAPGPRVRSRVLDPERANAPKDRSWGQDAQCPACGLRPE
ncbi:hypothetical protein SGCZBJ_20380 [Caulobacter zeae]|uniref:Uncharacterized protein n=1 Tax=Caulobacter zeae TaxID=2055137 RepID=A0A2N5D787_9CAUL|nr:ThiF family adenylyltransferase [Caulobacter zeae]PLR21924.1 hypothetical protein SGCZBJ_20380 [Caulobacter zeae]